MNIEFILRNFGANWRDPIFVFAPQVTPYPRKSVKQSYPTFFGNASAATAMRGRPSKDRQSTDALLTESMSMLDTHHWGPKIRVSPKQLLQHLLIIRLCSVLVCLVIQLHCYLLQNDEFQFFLHFTYFSSKMQSGVGQLKKKIEIRNYPEQLKAFSWLVIEIVVELGMVRHAELRGCCQKSQFSGRCKWSRNPLGTRLIGLWLSLGIQWALRLSWARRPISGRNFFGVLMWALDPD